MYLRKQLTNSWRYINTSIWLTVDGGLTDWSIWSTCTLSCGIGTQSRSRSCINPEPQYGGQDCEGALSESQDCNISPCPSMYIQIK